MPEIAELRKSDTYSSSNDILSRKNILNSLKWLIFQLKREIYKLIYIYI